MFTNLYKPSKVRQLGPSLGGWPYLSDITAFTFTLLPVIQTKSLPEFIMSALISAVAAVKQHYHHKFLFT